MCDSRIMAVSNRKGGSGKTTTSVNLSAALAHKGNRVLLLDTDPQGHSSLSLNITAHAGEAGLYSVLTGAASLDQATKKSYLKGLSVVPGGMQLAVFEKQHAANPKMRTLLARAIQKVRNRYNYIVIDTPPNMSLMGLSALIASTDVLVPMQAHYLAMEGLAEMVKLIRKINQIYRRDVRLMGVVPTFYQPKLRLSGKVIRDIKEVLGDAAILHPVRTNVSLAEAPGFGQSIFQYNLKCNGAYDYLALANQIEAK